MIRPMMYITIALLVGATASCEATVSDAHGSCGVISPAVMLRSLAPDDFGEATNEREASDEVVIALRADVPIADLGANYTAEQLACLVEHGDQLALLMLASQLKDAGRLREAEAILMANLPSEALALDREDLRVCIDPADANYFSCPAGLPENWLLLGDLILQSSANAQDIERAEIAYRRSAEIDFAIRDSGALVARWVNVRAAYDNLTGETP